MTPPADRTAAVRFTAALRPFRRRLLQHALLQQALDTLWPFAAGALLILITARLLPLPAETAALIGTALTWLLLQPLLVLLLPRSPAGDARRIDRLLGLHERVATAYAGLQSAAADEMVEQQRTDALIMLARRSPAELQIPLRRRNALIAVPLLAAVAAAVWLPNPQHELIARREAEARRREAAAEVLAAYRATLPQDAATAQLRADIDQLLARLAADELTTADALAELSAVSTRLQQESAAGREALRLTLDSLSRRLADLAQQPPDPPELQRDASERLAQTAERIRQLDRAQQRAAAQRFSQFAADTAAGPPDVSAALSDAANALNAGDAAAAAEALQRAAAAARSAESRLAADDRRADAFAALQQAREALTGAQAGSAPNDAAGPPQAAVTAQPAAVGSPNQPAAQAAATAPVSSGNPAAAPSTAGSLDLPIGVTSPDGVLGSADGPSAPGDLRLPAAAAQPAVSDAAAAPAYRQQLRAAVERAEIPAHLRGIVQAYFDQLAQTAP